jgi:hypothetical protein
MPSIEMLDSIDFFDGPTIAAHVIWPTEQEIPILVERKVGVIHNPTSNMKLASGIAPVAEMLNAGVRVGLGTDGAASNNDLDMWEEMRLAAFLQKIGLMNPEALPATAVLRMATSGGGEAIGLGDEIGSLVMCIIFQPSTWYHISSMSAMNRTLPRLLWMERFSCRTANCSPLIPPALHRRQRHLPRESRPHWLRETKNNRERFHDN